MSQLDPTKTTVGDICTAALKECGAIGVGQTPLAEDINDAWARLQWMIQQWERKRYLVYHLVTLSVVSTGAQTYTVGPGGNIDTQAAVDDPFSPAFGPQFGAGDPPPFVSARPAKLESAYLRQIGNLSSPNQVDFPLELLQSMEDYNRIRLKELKSFPGFAFLDPAWPLATLYPWPVPQASIYQIFITILEQLPIAFAKLTTPFALPYEYYAAMLYNLAMRLRPKYGIRPGRFVMDDLPGLARDSLNVLRQANAQIARLVMPKDLQRAGIYNIFGDRFY